MEAASDLEKFDLGKIAKQMKIVIKTILLVELVYNWQLFHFNKKCNC